MKDTLKSVLALLLIVVVLGGALFGLDRWTAPIVQARLAAEEEAAAAAGQEMLLALLPESFVGQDSALAEVELVATMTVLRSKTKSSWFSCRTSSGRPAW